MDVKARKRFEEELARIVRRVNRLKSALEGSADIEFIEVGECQVKAHLRSRHKRAIIRKRKPTRAKISRGNTRML